MYRIAVGTDGSAAAERAVVWAAAHAARKGGVLHIASTWSVPAVPYPEPGLVQIHAEREEQRAGDAAMNAEKLAREAGVRDVETTVSHGRADLVLSDLSKDVDLMVIGSTGHGTVGGFLLGSVGHFLAHHCRCPLVLVPEQGGEIPPASIVVGVDGSPSSQHALRVANEIATAHGARLRMLTSFERWQGVSAVPDSLARDKAREWTERWLDDLASDLAIDATPEVTSAPAADALLDADADLVVVGSRGRSAIAELVLGSVSRKVVYHARRPTLIVRLDEGS